MRVDRSEGSALKIVTLKIFAQGSAVRLHLRSLTTIIRPISRRTEKGRRVSQRGCIARYRDYWSSVSGTSMTEYTACEPAKNNSEGRYRRDGLRKIRFTVEEGEQCGRVGG